MLFSVGRRCVGNSSTKRICNTVCSIPTTCSPARHCRPSIYSKQLRLFSLSKSSNVNPQNPSSSNTPSTVESSESVSGQQRSHPKTADAASETNIQESEAPADGTEYIALSPESNLLKTQQTTESDSDGSNQGADSYPAKTTPPSVYVESAFTLPAEGGPASKHSKLLAQSTYWAPEAPEAPTSFSSSSLPSVASKEDFRRTSASKTPLPRSSPLPPISDSSSPASLPSPEEEIPLSTSSSPTPSTSPIPSSSLYTDPLLASPIAPAPASASSSASESSIPFPELEPVPPNDRIINPMTAHIRLRRPVGGFKGGLIGFLLSTCLVGGMGYFYLLDDYREASSVLLKSVEELKETTNKITMHIKRIEKVEEELDKVINGFADKKSLNSVKDEMRKLMESEHLDLLNLKAHVWGVEQDLHSLQKKSAGVQVRI